MRTADAGSADTYITYGSFVAEKATLGPWSAFELSSTSPLETVSGADHVPSAERCATRIDEGAIAPWSQARSIVPSGAADRLTWIGVPRVETVTAAFHAPPVRLRYCTTPPPA